MAGAPHWLRVQLSGPRGLLARPMAHLLNRVNRRDYQLALGELEARRGDTVLELGFGGGIGVDALLKQGARVIAAEPSEAMRERAFRHWSRPLAKGTMELWAHSAETLPAVEVDCALSMNTVYFWNDIGLGFANLRRMVKRRLVLGVASPSHLHAAGFADEGFRVEPVEWYAERLSAAGFDTRIVVASGPDNAAALIGEPRG